jgi:hypothetical protein
MKIMAEMSLISIKQLRADLVSDAQKAKDEPSFEQRPEWVDPKLWSKYTGAGGRRLYRSFSDEELLDIIRQEAALLGRVPAQREIFCVYRDYIRRRFGNWVNALRAAGLREPKKTAASAQ